MSKTTLLKSVLLLVGILGSSILLYKAAASADSVKENPPVRVARLSDGVSVQSTTRASASLTLSDGRDLLVDYQGPDRARAALQDNLAVPAALATADFDGDGVPDLICAYKTPEGGVIALLRGNVDAIHPNSPQAQRRKANGEFTNAPFLSPAKVFELAQTPDFVGAGDFDADGHQDLVIAKRGTHSLSLLPGDGHASFGTTIRIEVAGGITAFATGEVNRPDGLTDIVVGVLSASGPQALVYESPEGASKAAPEVFNLPSQATALVLGKLDDDYLMDFAAAVGREVIVIAGRDRHSRAIGVTQPRNGKHSFATDVRSIATGSFVDKDKPGIAVLTDDGALHLLGDSVAKKNRKKSDRINQWAEQSIAIGVRSAELVRARVSCAQTDSLVAIDSATHQMQIIADDPYAQKQSALSTKSVSRKISAFDVEGTPVATIPIRLNSSALDNLVVLRSGQTNPSVLTPQVMMTFTVLTEVDMTGVNSFRDAILNANANPGLDNIDFNIPPSGPVTIDLASPLPLITDPVVISGTSQPGFAGFPIVQINGTAVGGDGIIITAGNSTVSGLVINRFGGSGINLASGNNQVISSFIGTDLSGTAAAGNGQAGVNVNGPSNVIGLANAGNVISANGNSGVNSSGVQIANGSSSGNVVQSNLIGTDITGSIDLGNAGFGVDVEFGTDNTIGGVNPVARNVISGNNIFGVLFGGQTSANRLQGNFIGTNSAGTGALPNSALGAIIFGPGNTVGGTTPAAGNVISGNGGPGLAIGSGLAVNNLVQGNLIGTDAFGSADLGNVGAGVSLSVGVNNTIGGTAAGARNVISGNNAEGIVIDQDATSNFVQGNFVGTDSSGTVAIPNIFAGIFINSASGNTIGGTAAGARNVLSGNVDRGLTISGDGNVIQGNLIGTDASGTADLGNTLGGLLIVGSGNIVGGTADVARNIISGNNFDGVQIAGAGSSSNLIQGNFIGTDISGTADLGNSRQGVLISAAATSNTIGGTSPGARNIISGNDNDGLQIAGIGTSNNLTQGNFIGTDVSGTTDLGNSRIGVLISAAATSNTIGGTSAAARNVVSGNDSFGVEISNDGTTSNSVQGNFIGTDASGTSPLGNSDGVHINLGASGNFIGGSASNQGNVIAFNNLNGVGVLAATGNPILSNSIFLNSLLAIDLGVDGPTPNDQGDPDAGANNLQNFPILTSASVAIGSTFVQGSLNSTPNTTFTLQFFSNAACDDSGFGEGQQLIGTRTIGTDSAGNAIISFSFPGNFSLPITVTATDPAGNTSEFSPCALKAAGIDLAINKTASPGVVKPGDTLTYTITAVNNGSILASNVTVEDNLPSSITFVSCSSTGNGICLGSGNDRRVVFPALPAGASATITFVTTVKSPLPNGTLISNTATISSGDSDANPGNNTTTTAVVVSDAPAAIICPGNIARNANAGQCVAVVDYPPPTLTGPLIGSTVTCLPPSGSTFPAGVTTVNCSARNSTGATGNCSFSITVNSPASARVTLEGGASILNFGPAVVKRKNKKPANGCDCDSTLTIENIGCAAINLAVESIMRTGSDVTSGRITNPDDSKTFSVRLINNDQSETDLPIGGVVSIPTGQTRSFRVLFKPALPAVTGKTTGLAAAELLPDVITSKITFRQNGIEPIVINLTGRISTDVQIINPDNQKAAKRAVFTKSGNEFTVVFGVFDADLDVNRATFEFLDGNGQVVDQPFDIDLAQPISQNNIIKGQSFVITQRFTGAASHAEVVSVRVKVSDPHSSDSVTSQLGASAAAVQTLQKSVKHVVVLPIRRFEPHP